MASQKRRQNVSNRGHVTPNQETDWDALIATHDAAQIRGHLQSELSDLVTTWKKRLKGYSFIILYKDESIDDADRDKLYMALESASARQKTDILLIIVSNGGFIAPAYQISKVCREWAKERFIVAAPRQAKSAATLIALGADQVHMGPLSHLGPVDPQFEWGSGVSMEDSLNSITRRVKENPSQAVAEMWSTYLQGQLPIGAIGEYERTVIACAQYAERLLISGKSDKSRAERIAQHLVYEYKNHGFVIDSAEAIEIFGDSSVVTSSNELAFSEDVYRIISKVENQLKGTVDHEQGIMFTGIDVVGSVEDGVDVQSTSFASMLRKSTKEKDSE